MTSWNHGDSCGNYVYTVVLDLEFCFVQQKRGKQAKLPDFATCRDQFENCFSHPGPEKASPCL